MQTITQKIYAPGGPNTPGLQSAFGGRTLYVQGCDAGTTLSITMYDANGNQDKVSSVGAGCKLTPAAGFTKIDVETSADANVTLIITNGDIDIQLTQIGTNITNTSANPVPVSLVSEPGAPVQVAAPIGQEVNVKVQGTVNVSGATLTATNVGLIPAGAGISEVGTVAVPTGSATHVLAAAAGHKRAIFRNAGAGLIALGGASGVTVATAAIVLQPGDAWKETDGPHLDWYAASDTGSSVNIQTVS
ncbi:hypothetical protein [Burkholderia arboris]|uniref:hypothetical protein n=1 Tax=Burkholderia arboris TaxID=488730 RepID=UPI002108F4FB|nr:hypothetical protein [Burkholderia arboris]UTV53238.1 hypothetical protein NLX30_10070 [Burkholderia arboris]